MADKVHVIVSTVDAWPGEVRLPRPNDFNRAHWETWKKGIDLPRREKYANIHLFGYAGIEFIKQHGEWNIEGVTAAEVASWETDPAAERTRLLAWLARSMILYINTITDPKDLPARRVTG